MYSYACSEFRVQSTEEKRACKAAAKQCTKQWRTNASIQTDTDDRMNRAKPMMREPRSVSHCLRPYIVTSLLLAACVHGVIAFGPAPRVELAARPSAAALSIQLRQRQNHSPPERRRIVPAPVYSSAAPSAGSSDDASKSPGFSLTALRSTLRAATGFSLTAFRTTLRAATGISLSQTISGTIRAILDFLSPSLRYFMQPFLIMYYAPLLIIRFWMVGPSQQYVEESLKGHEKVVEGWRKAVEAAEKAHSDGYWPVHVNGELDKESFFRSAPSQDSTNRCWR